MLRRLLLAAGGGGSFVGPTWHRGTVSAGGSPATVLADTHGNRGPGIAWLDASHVLVTYNRDNADIYGTIGTVTGSWTFSWGTPFLIYHHASLSILTEESVSIIDNQVVVAGRLYNGTVNSAPFIRICNDPPASLTSSSTWGAPISIPLTSFTAHNLTAGRVHKLQNGTYLVGYYGQNTASNDESGVLISSSLTDWSARTKVVVGAVGANSFSEIDIEEMPDGTLVALDRAEGSSPFTQYAASSTDHGATWTALASAFEGHGYPAWRRLTSGLRLTIYRRSTSAFGPYWRQSADDGATWSSETLLDSTIVGPSSTMAYATILQLDDTHALAVYSITDDRFGTHPANLYSQVFTDSSTFS